jgi:micrococcal nuclease
MPSPKFSSTFLATVLFSLRLVASVGAQSLSGIVIAVADGDTISLRTDAVPPGLAVKSAQTISVRLEGIDAPEHGQPFGDASRKT